MLGGSFEARASSFLWSDRPDEILDGLFLGGEWCAKSKSSLSKNDIRSVLTVARGIPPQFPSDFEYMVLDILDDERAQLMPHFTVTNQFIDAALEKGGVLVHCHAGASRSATVVIAYLMYKLGIGWSKALDFVVSKRPVVCPNYGFLDQLEKYEKLLQQQREKPEQPEEQPKPEQQPPTIQLPTQPTQPTQPQPTDSLRELLYWFHTSK